MKKAISLTSVIFACTSSFALGAVLRVPGDYSTIQAGINASHIGDTVLIAEGVYSGPGNRDISLAGPAIVITSEKGPIQTLIDGEGAYNGFNISDHEGPATVISGLTITNVITGILCDFSAPTIKSVIIKNFLNYGISCDGYSGNPTVTPLIEDCLIFQQNAGYVGTGAGIFIYRKVEATISGCRISDCLYGMHFYSVSYQSPRFQVSNCVIRDNSSRGMWVHS